MLATLLLSIAFLASATCASKPDDSFEGYAFAYFTGNTLEGEKIYLAASEGNDALNWTELNHGQPILSSSKGSGGLRDPFIMRSHDNKKFFVIATDLSIGGGTTWGDAVRNGSRYVEIWESPDLVSWSEQRHVLVSPPTAGNTWAPEAFYDAQMGTYLLFWASQLYAVNDIEHTGISYERVLFAKTDDFVTFSEPVLWEDSGTSRIDSTILQAGKLYHRFTKDEGRVTGCTDIIQEQSSRLNATLDEQQWKTVSTCIGKTAGTGAVEGPTSFKSNPRDVNGDKYYLFLDEYGGRGYIPLETDDILHPNWTVSKNYRLPTSPRHGTVMPVTKKEHHCITRAYGEHSSLSQRSVANKISRRSNPALPGYYADPNIAVFGAHYYIYATTDGFPGWGGNQFFVWKSGDLTSWTRSTLPILTLNGTHGNVAWATGNAWAPTILQRNNHYYFYFSGNDKDLNTKVIGAAVATSPEGPFTAMRQPMILNNETTKSGQAIDPCAFHDPKTGRHFLFWGNGNALFAELKDDMVSVDWKTAASIQGLTDFREGIFLNYRRGIYHMTYSIDDTGSPNYRVGYATAASVYGPWTYRGIILQKDESLDILATGHDSIINVPGTDDWYIAYHRFHIPDGDGTHREVSIDKISFDPQSGLMRTVQPTLDGPPPQKIRCAGSQQS